MTSVIVVLSGAWYPGVMRRSVQLFELLTLIVLISMAAYWKFAPRRENHDNSEYLQMRSAAQAAWQEGRDDKCLQICQEMLSREPGELFALRYVGQVHLRRGQLAEAERWFDRGIARDGNFAEMFSAQRLGSLYRERARLKVAQKKWEEALKDAARAKELLSWGEDYELAQDVEACALAGAGRREEAKEAMPSDWREGPSHSLVLHHRRSLGFQTPATAANVTWHLQPCPLCQPVK